jgi:hypothetical protein
MLFAPWIGLLLIAAFPPTPLAPGGRLDIPLGRIEAGATYRAVVALRGAIGERDRIVATFSAPDGRRISKTLHAGDPSLDLPYRPGISGEASLAVESNPASGPVGVLAAWSRLDVPAEDAPAIEAEPNDGWKEANPLTIGRPIYGSSDDVEYLDNPDEGRSGLDWFRFEVADDSPALVYFQLELADRDVSANLRVQKLDPASGLVSPFEAGKDPTEVVHDRERERYSTHLSRVVTKGTYFVEVNANHPEYILRTARHPVPPLADPARAVEVGLDYLLQAGDAWFAQVPREGNAFVRSTNLHDTATRCTACHASSFPTEASLVGLANGYPIRAKASMAYLMDRLANSPTPLYGTEGLYWQRFIAIPLQAQGKQGGILMDFEAKVLGRETAESARFGPFLRSAWRGRRALPADEVNGVVPLDSKFGLAWRDWRVLIEMARRSGRVAYAQAADAIADILDDPETDRQVETLQDRIHRLYAWWLIDKDHFAPRIEAEARALLALQNPDGGWHEQDRKPGPSAVYTTGQMTWTLLKVGYHRDDPRLARALAYLLATQQPFGGWFQTTTHENFRTPMRETRYAVEALAEAFPRADGPRQGWGNRDGRPARLPRGSGPIVPILDDLDNLWEVPEPDRSAFASAAIRLLKHSDPLVRARAADFLGRLEDSSAAEPLAGLLGDPAKQVGRSAAKALRRLGNRGQGIEAIRRALQSSEPDIRRGATRVFAYHFSGMDDRLDLADLLIERTNDPDLWTRLQALRSLRQWFYRSNDAAFRRRIVDAYLARMARPDEPVVRKALVEGMYILLDENLGGGVSLQKNLAALPEKSRKLALEGRMAVERDVLLGPILTALESANALQREGIVRSFDGSFFRGRSYARQPTGMLDVGNDREFGFLSEPSADLLARAFAPLLSSELSPEARRRAILMAEFFRVSSRTSDPVIQLALLDALADPDLGVREAAGKALAGAGALDGSESDPARLARVQALLRGVGPSRRAVVRALASNRALMARPEILADLRAILAGDDPLAALPVLGWAEFSDAEILEAVGRAWPACVDDAERVGLLGAIQSRPVGSGDTASSSRRFEILRVAILDRSTSVREAALGVLGSTQPGRVSDRLLRTALADDAPAIRRVALGLAADRLDFWAEEEAKARLLALLVDPDPRVRGLALSVVDRHNLARGATDLARRLKSVASDPALRGEAEAILRRQGFDPNAIEADVRPGRSRLPGIATFREKVNPLFSVPGDDGQSCIRCHAGQDAFRLGEPTAKGSLVLNYQSARKFLNPGDPESSLLLRKPRSPQGGDDPQAAISPTGLTHVGGVRWAGIDHPASRAIREWAGETSAGPGPVAHVSADGHSPDFPPALAVDGDPATAWRTEFVGATPGYPHELTLDLGSTRPVLGLLYVPRQDGSEGRVKDYEVWLSVDGTTWSAPAASGSWSDTAAFQYLELLGSPARFLKLRGLSEINGHPSMSVGDLIADAPAPPRGNP